MVHLCLPVLLVLHYRTSDMQVGLIPSFPMSLVPKATPTSVFFAFLFNLSLNPVMGPSEFRMNKEAILSSWVYELLIHPQFTEQRFCIFNCLVRVPAVKIGILSAGTQQPRRRLVAFTCSRCLFIQGGQVQWRFLSKGEILLLYQSSK